MGAGASFADSGLTAEEKVGLCRELQNKYAELSESGAVKDGADMFKSLAEAYNAKLSSLPSNTATNSSYPDLRAILDTLTDVITVEESEEVRPSFRPYEEEDENGEQESKTNTDGSIKHKRLIGADGVSTKSYDAGSTPTTTTIDHIDDDFDHDNPILRHKTSQDLLKDIDGGSIKSDHVDKLSFLMKQMNEGDVKDTRTSQFRKRRLTYSQKQYGQSEPTPPEPRQRAKRTTIYASTEIGVRQEKVAPFPENYLGTFSCHGIEPGDNDEVFDKINQDRGCVVYPYNSSMTKALFLVLDGHGEQGDKVSEFVMRQVVISLEKHQHLIADPALALKETFVKTNMALQATEINFMTSGCTCVCAYVIGTKLYVANCGDSRAVMARGSTSLENLVSAELSRDHKPDDPTELDRIVSLGGFVQPAPEPGLTARVYLDAAHTMIGLAMARSIGDYAVKQVGVIAEPEVEQFEISSEDQFMILASDGVWEFIYSQEAVDIVSQVLRSGGTVTEACQELIEQSAQRWVDEEGDYRDDITAIIIRFPLPHQSSIEEVGMSSKE